uniref:ADP-ribosylation factor n=1 Tax=Chromera velia CCMP2878 TaxID=1169474 RepID=A0A0G4H782_9ALVE|eukprot:Cvel_24988.t1-p1 / transcript=Cvel_24988.t1 / gene=Cvel_24988 / organism=Chromera_velia_CCMP2878 / gene_product=ADP-ribosylation factor, putative / transcript_product=ADP-ribosylation factor, putative / location=Cvel_scaffold2769:17975-19432(-) / protein_length=486 / sequence_SO=supercontig / SO=protein_coding / is_pseudo=false
MLGLDAAGKTSLLYSAQLGEVTSTIPTIGFNVESVKFKGTLFTVWDVGGRSGVRALWRHYFQDTSFLVFVVDSNDTERIEDVKEELITALFQADKANEGRAPVPLLVFANKQDLPNALSPESLVRRLDLFSIAGRNRLWHVTGITALSRGCRSQFLAELGDFAERTRRASERAALTEAREEKKGTEVQQKKRETELTSDEQNTEYQSEKGVEREQEVPGENENSLVPLKLSHSATVAAFSPIQKGTACPFAKTAKLWGAPPPPTPMESPDRISNVPSACGRAAVPALTGFVESLERGLRLDGFLIRVPCLPPSGQSVGLTVEEWGVKVRECLTALGDGDPSLSSGADRNVMGKRSVGERGWRFTFNGASFFITSFAPCYPKSHPRYAHGSADGWVLLQPDISFARRGIPDTHDNVVVQRVRAAFADAGASYSMPPTVRFPTATQIVRPLSDSDKPVKWWLKETELESSAHPWEAVTGNRGVTLRVS